MRSLTSLRLSPLVAIVALVACSSSSPTSPSVAATSPLISARPYTLEVPDSYDASKATPLLVMLHGYSASGALENIYMGLSPMAQKYGFLYAYADGTEDKSGKRFWNATDACCNFDGSTVDDVAYLDAILDDVAARYNVDAKRVYFVGHSNGAFMANRYACDRSSRVAAIVSLAGAQFEDATKCVASEPVAMLEVHGDKDDEILYDGGANEDSDGTMHAYPSAAQTVATWAQKDGCTGAIAATGRTLDLDLGVDGSETVETSYGPCPAGTTVSLWTMQGVGHVPGLGASWGDSIWGFLSAFAKP